MKKIALPTLITLSTVVAAPAAFAQSCPPGSWLCADVQIGTGVAQPPVVVEQPVVQQPPVVVYQPPPPPQTVYIQQPRVVVTTVPTYTTYQTTYQPTYSWVGMGREQAFGIAAHVGGAFLPGRGYGTSAAGMWGAGGSLRFRSHPWLATELTFDVFSGRDYNGDSRTEMPFTLNELVYLNPQNRFQFYGLLGLGLSWAAVTHDGGSTVGGTGSLPTTSAFTHGPSSDNYAYIGGQLGFGAEWQITPRFSLYSDVRGFLRTRIDQSADSSPEFTRTSDGHTQTSNTSMGSTFQLGALLYF